MGKLKDYIQELRPFEILLELGAPFLGIIISMQDFSQTEKILIFLIGTFFLDANVFCLNDYFGMRFDVLSPIKKQRPLISRRLSSYEVLILGIIYGVIALIIYLFLSKTLFIFGIIFIIGWILYAHPRILFKSYPFISTLWNFFFGGMFHFLIGYALFSPIDEKGIYISLYFGILGGIGALQHEIVDAEGDKNSGFKTTAIFIGERKSFNICNILSFISIIYLFYLSFRRFLPFTISFVVLSSLPFHMIFLNRIKKDGINPGSVGKFKNRYRKMYAVIGILFAIIILLGKICMIP